MSETGRFPFVTDKNRIPNKAYDTAPANMSEDPAYPNVHEFENKDNIFGYRFYNQNENGTIDAIGGASGEVPYIHLGDFVELAGDPNGLYGAYPGDQAVVIGIKEPFSEGVGDHICTVRTVNGKVVNLRPYQIKPTFFVSEETKNLFNS